MEDVDKVYLPLEKLDCCYVCHETPAHKSQLRLCSKCADYTAQKNAKCKIGSGIRKKECGPTYRIDLESFYPFLAWLNGWFHAHPVKPGHFALNHQIVNDANPYVAPVVLPNGKEVKLLVVDDTDEPHPRSPEGRRDWCSEAEFKLHGRIVASGFVLPIVMSLASALMSRVYTTSPEWGPDGHRVRLKYRSSPISDFGIVAGSVNITPDQTIAFKRVSNEEISIAQDADDHYWLYFTTVRGEELLLDCSLYPFDFTLMVDTKPHIPSVAQVVKGQGPDLVERAPALFYEREMRKMFLPRYTERKRMSLLRNKKLQDNIDLCEPAPEYPGDWKSMMPLFEFMQELAGRELDRTEKELFQYFSSEACWYLYGVLVCNDWQNYPPQPHTRWDYDPREMQMKSMIMQSLATSQGRGG